MAILNERPDRLVLPRWREFKKTASSKELASVRLDVSKPQKLNINQQIKNWKSSPSFVTAAELVNSAFIANEFESAKPAASFILERCPGAPDFLVRISKIIANPFGDSLKPCKRKEEFSFDNITRRIGEKINETRSSLKRFSHNPMLWVDLARLHTVNGKFGAAEKAIRTALHLASENVFVVRSAVRFFLHLGNEESYKHALNLIRKNPCTKHDPWLLATEISLCAFLYKSSNLMRVGLQMIDSKNYSLFSTSELTAAIATEELRNGYQSKSRKLFNAALSDPNENSFAQAEWARKHIGNLNLDFDTQDSSEALSYAHFHSGNWNDSYEKAMDWIVDEPFSKEPCKHASFVASDIIDDNEKSLEICDFGLRSNPFDFGLLNNKAYALAVLGRVDEAVKTFNQISENSLKNDYERIVYSATKGLINYQKKKPELGEHFYNLAIDLSLKSKDKERTSLVRAYKMRAEFLTGYNKIDKSVAVEIISSESKNLLRPYSKKIFQNICSRIVGKNSSIIIGNQQEKTNYLM